MRTFISIGPYGPREVNILLDEELRSELLLTARHHVQKIKGLSTPALLQCQPYPFPAGTTWDVGTVPLGERLPSELQAISQICPLVAEDDSWNIILRPGKGLITSKRLTHFVEGLRSIPADCSHAVSIIPVGSLANPFWATHYYNRSYFHGTHIARARFTGWSCGNAYQLAPELDGCLPSEKNLWNGSQHIDPILKNDHALCAIRYSSKSERDIPAPRPVAFDYTQNEDNELLSWAYNLFLFDEAQHFTETSMRSLLTIVKAQQACGA